MPETSYRVSIDVVAKTQLEAVKQAQKELDKLAKETEKTQSAFGKLKSMLADAANPAKILDGVLMGVGSALTNMAVSAIKQIPQVTKELVDLGLESEAVTHRFTAASGLTACSPASRRASIGSLAVTSLRLERSIVVIMVAPREVARRCR